MAAQSRLPLRSSARHRDRSAGVDELPATVIQRNPSTFKARKRTLSLSADHQNGKLAKKPRTSRSSRSSPDIFTHSNAKVLRTYGARNLATPSRESLTQVAVGLREQPTVIVQPTPPQSSHPFTDHGESQSKVHQAQPINDAATNKVDKRSLRSHDGGSRWKSELASYFVDYDEIMSNEPREPGTVYSSARN